MKKEKRGRRSSAGCVGISFYQRHPIRDFGGHVFRECYKYQKINFGWFSGVFKMFSSIRDDLYPEIIANSDRKIGSVTTSVH